MVFIDSFRYLDVWLKGKYFFYLFYGCKSVVDLCKILEFKWKIF